MLIYKYQPINKITLQNLIKGKNWISDPKIFNDPFEFKIQNNYSLNEKGKTNFLNLNEVQIREIIKKS